MGFEIEYSAGQTPLDDDEKDGLLISTVTTKGELDEVEQRNIEKAIEWTLTRKLKKEIIFSEGFVRKLHRKMYGDVWKSAGEFRRTEKNIGVDPNQIGVNLKQLNGNCLHWIENKVYPDDEIAIRYKHELVKIHCFANGNGRHSRLMADIIISQVFNKPVFDWSRTNSNNIGEERGHYLKSLRDADKNNIKPLIKFANKKNE